MKLIRGAIFILLTFVVIPPIYSAISLTINTPQVDNEIITIPVSITGFTSSNCASSSACFLQGALQKSSGDTYFGSTRNNNGDWYSCKQSQDKEFIKSNFFTFYQTNGDWSGTLSMKAEISGGYVGPGEYRIKVWRYTGNSDSPAGESNELVVNIIQPTLSPTPTNSPTPTPTPTISLQPSAGNTSTPTNTPTKSPSTTSTKTPTPKKSPTLIPISNGKLTITPTEGLETHQLESQNQGVVLGTTDYIATSSSNGNSFPSKKVIIVTCLFLGIGSALLSLAFVLRKQFFNT